jgi:ribosomal protein S18 acetylase RimI-like enzyme
VERLLTLQVRRADPARRDELAAVAARTFPLACPPSCTEVDIAAFVAEHLTAARFADYLTDPTREILTATAESDDGPVVGYAMTVTGEPVDDDVARAVGGRPTVEVSKLYVLPDAHGSGVAAALMAAVLDHARAAGARSVWLGVNQRNERAQRFYAKQGFAVTGTKTFRLGAHLEADYVMARPV